MKRLRTLFIFLIVIMFFLLLNNIVYLIKQPTKVSNLEPEVPVAGRTVEIRADIGLNTVQSEYGTISMRIRVTAYCPCKKCCGDWADGQTASGYWIQPGDRFVAAPKHIPFGTKLILPGYNNSQPVEVKDRGGAITVERLDVFFGFDPNNYSDPHQKALEWGVKYLKVEIIKD